MSGRSIGLRPLARMSRNSSASARVAVSGGEEVERAMQAVGEIYPNIMTVSGELVFTTTASIATYQAAREDPAPRFFAGWSSPVARQAHNLKVVGSNPTPATKIFHPFQ